MTKDELSQLYYIDRELKDYEDKLRELEAEATRTTTRLNSQPNGKGTQDKIGALVAQISDLKDLIDDTVLKRIKEKYRLIRYIESIDDSLIRQIFKHRYMDCMTWLQVAFAINETDEQYPRRKHNAYLEKLDENDD